VPQLISVIEYRVVLVVEVVVVVEVEVELLEVLELELVLVEVVDVLVLVEVVAVTILPQPDNHWPEKRQSPMQKNIILIIICLRTYGEIVL